VYCAQVAETWDSCIENTIRKLAYGALGGGLAAMILFRAWTVGPVRCAAALHGRPLARAPLATSCALSPSLRLAPFTGAPAARSAVAGLGAGIGVGMGYTDCKYEFDAVDKDAVAK